MAKRHDAMQIRGRSELIQVKDELVSETRTSQNTETASDDFPWSSDLTAVLLDSHQKLIKAHNVLASLHPYELKLRQETIAARHPATFEWLLSTEADARSVDGGGFREWLRAGNGTYWITGKAGSRKSTLMKYIVEDPRTKSYLQEWADPHPVVVASHFLWSSGSVAQKSVHGLLKSLLYDVLRGTPALIPVVTPLRWSQHAEIPQLPWGQREVEDVFTLISKQDNFPIKFCLLIDGLDEYAGDHRAIIAILNNLATLPDFKVCLSSRPWNVFERFFGTNKYRKLVLQDFNRQDIYQYVKKTLVEDESFRVMIGQDVRYEMLVEKVVEMAKGVFL